MNITLDKFIKDFCVRKKEHLTNPPLHSFSNFVLPKNSHLHFLTQDEGEIGIKATNPLLTYLTQTKGKKVSLFVTGYSETPANGFKLVTMDLKETIRDYYKRNRGIVNGFKTTSDLLLEKNLVITNYSLMDVNAKYFNNLLSWYYQYKNYWASVTKYIETAVAKDRRTHFVIIDLPELPPSVSQLKKLQNEMRDADIRKLANSERMMISSFWNWFDEASETLLSRDIAVNNRLFYIFRYHDKWLCASLPMIKAYMKTPTNSKGTLSLKQMRNNFYAMLLSSMGWGDIESILVDDEDEVLSNNALEEEDANTLSKSRRETIDTSLQAIETSPDTISLDAVKDKIIAGVEEALVKAVETDEFTKAEDKRQRKVDKLLDGLEQLNADAVDVYEAPENGEQSILKSDTGEVAAPLKVIDYKEYTPVELTHEEAFNVKLREAVLKGNISSQQMRRLEKLAGRYKEIPNPITGQGTLETAAKINPEDLVISNEKKFIDKINMVTDESMLKSSLLEFDKKYINNVLNKDVFNAVLFAQRRGIAVQNYQIKRIKRLGDEYDIHSVKLVPIEGEPSTLSFKVAVINDYGVFNSRSVKMRSRKQRIDVPIRKISHDEVALTSDVSKFFVERSQFTAYSSEIWLRGQLVALNDPNIKINWGSSSSVVEGSNFDRMVDRVSTGKAETAKDINANKRTPLIYSMIGRSVRSIETPKYQMFFSAADLEQNFGKDVVKVFDSSRGTQILLGKGKDTLLILTNNGIVHECSIDRENNVELGTLESLLGIDVEKKPTDCADAIMLNKSIPIGVLLAYYIGLGNLLKTLKVDYTFIPKNTRGFVKSEDSVVIKFADGTLSVNVKGNYKAQLIIAGFNRYKASVKRFNLHEFDKPNVYGTVFADAGLPARFLREFNILRDMWVDPIAYNLLKEMGEPTDFILLLLRAVEMLEYDQHPEEMDRAYQRDRGYERISGFVYSQLVKSIRAYDSTPIRSKAKISMNPEAVWMDLIGDETTAPIEESNPIHNVKEMETVVYRGAGGRTARTMNANSRKFSKNSIGVDSESTVDNGDAGTVRYLTANPNYNSLRGTANVLDVFDETVNSTCLNTTFLLSPGLEFDDPKRRNFAQIQNSRTTNAEGSHISPVRTGYERVLPYRTSDLYATMASGDGKVIRVTDMAIVVKYKTGEEKSIELGKRDGKWAGKVIPHEVIPNLKEGQSFKQGDCIAYNPMFFEIDNLGGTLAYKSGVLCRVGLVEEEFTFEDASEISAKFAGRLTTKNCEERYITVKFEQDVNNMVKVGNVVEYDTTLCILQNNIAGVVDVFSGKHLDALKDISSLTPRSKHDGVVTDITAIYVGEVENMSQTLQDIVNASDRKLYKKARDMGTEKETGQKKIGERYEGKTLEPNTVLIKVTIDITQDMGIGSKVVYSHQMKSVVSNIWDGVYCTQDGQEYDGKFSYTSFVKRIVKSGILVGILNTYSVETGKRFCEIYEDE